MGKGLRVNCNERRRSTIIRHNGVHYVYKEIVAGLGEFAHMVPKSYIYDKIRERTGLCEKTIAYILNHTKEV